MPMLSEDPVHLIDEGYDELVDKILTRLDDSSFSRQTTTPLPSANSGGGRALYQHHRRQQWVAADDTNAHRDYNVDSRRYNWRGRAGHGAGRGGGRVPSYRGRGSGHWRGNQRGKPWLNSGYQKRNKPY
jgi:hypothetical protein